MASPFNFPPLPTKAMLVNHASTQKQSSLNTAKLQKQLVVNTAAPQAYKSLSDFIDRDLTERRGQFDKSQAEKRPSKKLKVKKVRTSKTQNN
jgi:hypothetical protein